MPLVIEQVFKNAQAQRRKVLIPYIMAGDPDLAATARLVPEIARAGADVIELGIPFSEPIADGPVIQQAASRALVHDTSLADVIALVKRLRGEGVTVPIVLMSYYNPILQYGEAAFVADAVAAGVNGVIVPDLPPEEGKQLIALGRQHRLATIFLLAPTSDARRIRLVTRVTTGFVYYVSMTGITGARFAGAAGVKNRVREIRAVTTRPIAVGFGVSTPDEARAVADCAEGVIVGSALVKTIAQTASPDEAVKAAGAFVAALRAGLDR